MRKFLTILALLATVSAIEPAWAGDVVFLEVGESFTNVNKVTTDPTAGSPNLLGTIQPLVSLGAKLGSFRPEFGYTIIARKPADNSYRSTLMIIQVPYLFEWAGTDVKVGPTYWIQKISGSGGDVTLSNGTGTATFSLPGRSSSTKTLGFLIGDTIPITDSFALDLDLTILSPLSKRRSFNFIAQLSWSFYDL